jgi:hypothetical protein
VDTQYIYPEGSRRIERAVAELHLTFENYMREYCGYEYNCRQHAFGYWTNPQGYWDWYAIGGRWRNLLRVRQGVASVHGEQSALCKLLYPDDPYLQDPPAGADIAKIKDVDFEAIEAKVDDAITKFFKAYVLYKASQCGDLSEEDRKELNALGGAFYVGNRLQRLGVIRCIKPREPVLDENGERVRDASGCVVFDDGVFEEDDITLHDLKTKYRWDWQFGTYAVVDDEGWHAKGEMGCWGMSSESPEDAESFSKSYMERFILNEDPETTLVVVDCHT